MRRLVLILEICLLTIFSYTLGHDIGLRQGGNAQLSPPAGCPYLDSLRQREDCPYLRGLYRAKKPARFSARII